MTQRLSLVCPRKTKFVEVPHSDLFFLYTLPIDSEAYARVKMNNSNDIDSKKLIACRRSHQASSQPSRLPDTFKRVGRITLFMFYSWCGILTFHFFLMLSGNMDHTIMSVVVFWLPLAILLCEVCRRRCLFDLLPAATRQEYLHGRLYLPFYGKEFITPLKFFFESYFVELRADSLVLPRGCLLWMEKYIYSSKKPYSLETDMWIIPWSHVIGVDVFLAISDEFGDVWAYEVQLISKCKAIIRTRSRVDPRLLDAFRTIGRKPVRIKHEIG